jgi:acetyltransferase
VILAELTAEHQEALSKQLPPAASVRNPVDVLGDALGDRYAAAIGACAKDPNIDGVVALLTPQVMTPCEDIAQAIIDTHKKYPLMPVVAGFMGDEHVQSAVEALHAHGIPNFPTPERAVRALASLAPNGKWKMQNEKDIQKSFSISHFPFSTRPGLLSEEHTAELFKAYGLPLPSGAVARDEDEAAKLAAQIGFPVVAKISSPQILHKTDIGCVKVNLKSEVEVRRAFSEIMQNAEHHLAVQPGEQAYLPAARRASMPAPAINGVFIQQFLPAGDEFIVGAIKDPSFGHLVMAGLGGIYTELFRDTAFRIAPIGETDAYAMLQELRSWKMLLGLRGKSQSDIAALAAIITKISQLVTDCPGITELDLNPVIVRPDGVVIADAKVIVE